MKTNYILKKISTITVALLLGCTGGRTIELEVENPTATARDSEVVVVDFPALQKKIVGLRLENDIQFAENDGTLLPTQFDDLDGNKKWDEIAFLADFAPGETRTFRFKKRFLRQDSSENSAHLWVSMGENTARQMLVDDLRGHQLEREQRYAGITWGTHSHTFRLRFDGFNAIDILPENSGKRIVEQQLDSLLRQEGITWPPEHPQNRFGGLGGFRFWHGDSLYPPLNLFAYQAHILARGPLRTIVRLDYEDWPVGEKKYKVTWLIMSYHHRPVMEHRIYFKALQADVVVPPVAVHLPGLESVDEAKGIFRGEWPGENPLQLLLVAPPAQISAPGSTLPEHYVFISPDATQSPPLRYYVVYGYSGDERLITDAVQLAEQLRAPVQPQL